MTVAAVPVTGGLAVRSPEGREGDGFHLLHGTPAKLKFRLQCGHVGGICPGHDDTVPLRVTHGRDDVRHIRIGRASFKGGAGGHKSGGRIFAVNIETQVKIIAGKPGPAAGECHYFFCCLGCDRQGHVGVHGGGQTGGHGIQFFPGGDRAGYGRAAHIKPKRAAFGRGSGQRYRGGGLLAGGRIFCGYGPGLHIAVGLFNGREHGVEHGADAKQRSRLIRRCNADRGQLGMRAGGQLLSDHEQFVRIGRRAGEGVLVIELHIGQRHADGGRNIVEANGHCLPPCPMRASQG